MPADRELTLAEKRELQLQELKLLQQFHILCRENHLTYYLTAGTLLGAVRHCGFIPWDDDVDVAMPRRDYNRLREICRTALADPMFYQDETTEADYPYFFAKIRRSDQQAFDPELERMHIRTGIYIDIFPLDVCPKAESTARMFFKTVEVLTAALLGRVNPDFVCGYTKPYMKAAYHLFRLLPNNFLKGVRRGLCRLAAAGGNGRLCTVGGAHGYPREAYQAEWFAQTVDLLFESDRYPAPAGWDALLTNMYGDYHTPPTAAEMAGHFQHQRKENEHEANHNLRNL